MIIIVNSNQDLRLEVEKLGNYVKLLVNRGQYIKAKTDFIWWIISKQFFSV